MNKRNKNNLPVFDSDHDFLKAFEKREKISIFGDDYPTPDETCIRDYIHVVDLAEVHVLALRFLEQGNPSGIYNCGYGHGYSVREIIDAVKKVSGVDFRVIETDRRPGDPAQLVADPGKLLKEMKWKPKYDDIEEIVRTAY